MNAPANTKIARPSTVRYGFWDCGGKPLFEVAPGRDVTDAVTNASCLISVIAGIARQGVEAGMDSDASYTVEFIAEAAAALLHSIERAVSSASEATL